MSGVHDLRVALAESGVLDACTLVMDYEDGGKVCRYTIGGLVLRLSPMATVDQVRDAILKEQNS